MSPVLIEKLVFFCSSKLCIEWYKTDAENAIHENSNIYIHYPLFNGEFLSVICKIMRVHDATLNSTQVY